MGIRLDHETIYVQVADPDGRIRVEERPGCRVPWDTEAPGQCDQIRVMVKECSRRAYAQGFQAGKLSVYQSMLEEAKSGHSN